MIVENFLELIDIDDIIITNEYVNMVDISVEGDESFTLGNGIISHNSAGNSCRKYRDPQTQAIFNLKGKFVNSSKITDKVLLFNPKDNTPTEASHLMNAIGLELNKPVNPKNLRFSEILILTDKDYDGDAIAGLLINFLSKWKELFDMGIVYRVATPLLVIKNGANTKYFYTNTEWKKYQEKNSLKGWEIEFKKGLGSLQDTEYQDFVKNPKKIKILWDNDSKKFLDCWFGEDVELRKNLLT